MKSAASQSHPAGAEDQQCHPQPDALAREEHADSPAADG